MKAKKIVVKS